MLCNLRITLETFLSGMETGIRQLENEDLTVLETFLSGMETPLCPCCCRAGPHALKPSLVEWKRANGRMHQNNRMRLETFLSGMETTVGVVREPGHLEP